MSHKFWKPGSSGPGQHVGENAASAEDRPAADNQSSLNDDLNSTIVFNSNSSLAMDQQRKRLPVFKHRTEILFALETYQTVILVGETGSGKSTQVPQYLLESGWAANGHLIGVTQPRRVAVTTVASRIADERGSRLGDEVGYTIRFDDVSDPLRTRVRVMTDGLLIREMMRDPLLTQYSVIMLDEVHERSIFTDILLGLMKKILRKRKDLRLIVSSATLDAETFREFFDFKTENVLEETTKEPKEEAAETSVIMSIQGRTFPVQIFYADSPLPEYLKASVETVIKIHESQPDGDILLFLTGQEQVETVCRMLKEYGRDLNDGTRAIPSKGSAPLRIQVLPLYGSLPYHEQMRVFERTPKNHRKVVVSTNVAEASVTIPNIVYVVDSGFVKLRAINPTTGFESLMVVETSRASAMQRAGRAGRVRAGYVFRLYTEESFSRLPKKSIPEMQRCHLSYPLLQLKALGIRNLLRFPFLSPPSSKNMIQGLEILFALGALTEKGDLTSDIGLKMAEFPLPPMFSKTLLHSISLGCTEEILSIVAMLQVQNVFVVPSGKKKQSNKAKLLFAVEEGDQITLLNVHDAFVASFKSSKFCKEHFLNYKGLLRALEIRAQLSRLLRRLTGVKNFASARNSIEEADEISEAVTKCLISGFFSQAAAYHPSGVYKTIREGQPLHIHPTSVLFARKPPPILLFNEVVQTTTAMAAAEGVVGSSGEAEYSMRDVIVIKEEWLLEMAPHYYQKGTPIKLS